MSGGLLTTRALEKVWGRDGLPAPFVARDGERIGEIWFETPPALDGLLVKYLFTSERLSVQVHPANDQVPDGGSGKEECWLVLDTDPGATLALGFREDISAEVMRAAALDGSIESLLDWREVHAGDFFYLPAGTVHALGAGITLVEVQQAADITYRLYDYGRPRELHIEDAMRVAKGAPYPADLARRVDPGATMLLVDGPHFRLAHVARGDVVSVRGWFDGAVQVMPLDGAVTVAGVLVLAGGSGWADSLDEVVFPENGRCLIAAPL